MPSPRSGPDTALMPLGPPAAYLRRCLAGEGDAVVVLAPHPDDEAIGCGGYVRLAADRGARVVCVHVSAGWSGVRRDAPRAGRTADREAEARRAAAELGISTLEFLRLDDRSLVHTDFLAAIVDALSRHQPRLVLAPHLQEDDRDHRAVAETVREAAWLARDSGFAPATPPAAGLEAILWYEVWSPVSRPDLLCDVSAVFAQKLTAVNQYRSQFEEVDYARMVDGLTRYRGAQARCDRAEAFLVEPV